MNYFQTQDKVMVSVEQSFIDLRHCLYMLTHVEYFSDDEKKLILIVCFFLSALWQIAPLFIAVLNYAEMQTFH